MNQVLNIMPKSLPSLYDTLNYKAEYHLPTPEQRLYWGVLERAILDATGNVNNGPPWATEDARRWLKEEISDSEGITFNTVCEYLFLKKSKVQLFVNTCIRNKIVIRNRFVPVKFMRSILDG